MSACPQCDQPGIFGYRDKNTGEMTWYCATHRLGEYWADARRDQCTSPPPDHPSSASPICNLHAVNEPNVRAGATMNKAKIIAELENMVAARLFGRQPWLADRETYSAVNR